MKVFWVLAANLVQWMDECAGGLLAFCECGDEDQTADHII